MGLDRVEAGKRKRLNAEEPRRLPVFPLRPSLRRPPPSRRVGNKQHRKTRAPKSSPRGEEEAKGGEKTEAARHGERRRNNQRTRGFGSISRWRRDKSEHQQPRIEKPSLKSKRPPDSASRRKGERSREQKSSCRKRTKEGGDGSSDAAYCTLHSRGAVFLYL